MKYALLFLALLLTACEPSGPLGGTMPEKPKPISYKADWSNLNWTITTLLSIDSHGKEMLEKIPPDMEGYCPKDTENKKCYVAILSALSKFESGHKPESSYKEDFKDSKGAYVISRGLFQISQESANGYGCGITKPEMLYNPETNIECAVKIMNRWVSRDGVIAGGKTGAWKGMARYWSPFRKESRVKEIKAITQKLTK